jgi:hypothetical protein
MKTLPPQIADLFERHDALSGFSVRGLDEIPDNCPRSGDDAELFVGDIGISPALSPDQYAEIFQELVVALAQLIDEEPEAAEDLRGRTFARVLH